ncbi:putative transcription factor WD40-like family [Helianthus anomalus]
MNSKDFRIQLEDPILLLMASRVGDKAVAPSTASVTCLQQTSLSPWSQIHHNIAVCLLDNWLVAYRYVEKAYNPDLHCVDWNPSDENLLLTWSVDNTLHMFHRRNLTANGIGSPIHIFENHKAAVLCVHWSPDKSSVFGSSAEDGVLNIWDHNKIGELSGPSTKPGCEFG